MDVVNIKSHHLCFTVCLWRSLLLLMTITYYDSSISSIVDMLPKHAATCNNQPAMIDVLTKGIEQ
jgi:hypothetical protein